MISVYEALESIHENTSPLNKVELKLSEALGYTLADAIFSAIDMPPFDNSAMDGYAINEWESHSYTVVGEIQAGFNAAQLTLKPGEAARIFTGAMVPSGTTTVVKQEITERNGDIVKAIDTFHSGSNIRRKAEQIEKGALALKKGSLLDAASIGFLAMLGVTHVSVYRKPKIKVLVTGDELIDAGNPLAPGQIYESNAITLISALNQFGCNAQSVRVHDDYKATFEKVGDLLKECDLLLTSGGISVGDYDFVWRAMKENGVEQHFYKVKQKPGKPLYYGSTDNCQVFALPGNPASALTCTYVYVLPAIRKMMGANQLHLETRSVKSLNTITKRGGLTHFQKGVVGDEGVQALNHQSSSMLDSFSKANCLIVIPEDIQEVAEGDTLTVLMLP